MGLVKQVFDKVGELAREGRDGEFRQYIQRSAYFDSQAKGDIGGPDHFWYAALASATLNLLAEREGADAHPIQVRYERYMEPSEFKTRDSHSEWDAEDIRIIKIRI